MAHLVRPAAWGRSRASRIKRSGAGHAADTRRRGPSTTVAGHGVRKFSRGIARPSRS